MSVVKIDAQRRIYVPKVMPFKAEKAVIIPQGSAYLLIPVPKEPIEIDVKLPIKKLRTRAEERARKDVLERARRRSQL